MGILGDWEVAKENAYTELYVTQDTEEGEEDLARQRAGNDVLLRVIKDGDGSVLTSEERVREVGRS